MLQNRLTHEEQSFAEEHIDLIYRFLRQRHLPEAEYYDVVIFGYLEAVQYHCRVDDSSRDFTGLAYTAMERKFLMERRRENAVKRKCTVFSLDNLLNDKPFAEWSAVLTDWKQNPARKVENRDLIARIWERTTETERQTLKFYLAGYSYEEITEALNISIDAGRNRVRNFRKKARAVRDNKPVSLSEAFKECQRRYRATHKAEINAKRRAYRKAKRDAKKAASDGANIENGLTTAHT